MGCSTKAVKTSTIVFNVIFGLFGIFFIIGVSMVANEEGDEDSSAFGGFIIGALVIIFAIVGCYAAAKESYKLAITCTVFYFLLIVLHIVAICLHQNSMDPEEGNQIVDAAWDNYSEMSVLETKFECCGRTTAQEYIHIGREIPSSCYSTSQDFKNILSTQGCGEKIQAYLDSNNQKIIVINWVVVVAEVVGFFLHLYMLIKFRNKQRRAQF